MQWLVRLDSDMFDQVSPSRKSLFMDWAVAAASSASTRSPAPEESANAGSDAILYISLDSSSTFFESIREACETDPGLHDRKIGEALLDRRHAGMYFDPAGLMTASARSVRPSRRSAWLPSRRMRGNPPCRHVQHGWRRRFIGNAEHLALRSLAKQFPAHGLHAVSRRIGDTLRARVDRLH